MTDLDLADQIISLLKDRVPTEKEFDTVLPFIAKFRRALNQGTEEKVREARLAEAEQWRKRGAYIGSWEWAENRLAELRAVPAAPPKEKTDAR